MRLIQHASLYAHAADLCRMGTDEAIVNFVMRTLPQVHVERLREMRGPENGFDLWPVINPVAAMSISRTSDWGCSGFDDMDMEERVEARIEREHQAVRNDLHHGDSVYLMVDEKGNEIDCTNLLPDHARARLEEGETITRTWLRWLQDNDLKALRKLDRMTWAQAVEMSKEWAIEEDRKENSVRHPSREGWMWVRLYSERSLDAEGGAMEHCIDREDADQAQVPVEEGGYWSLRDADGNRVMTLQFYKCNGSEIEIGSFLGRKNRQPEFADIEHLASLRAFYSNLGVKVSPERYSVSESVRLPSIVVDGHELTAQDIYTRFEDGSVEVEHETFDLTAHQEHLEEVRKRRQQWHEEMQRRVRAERAGIVLPRGQVFMQILDPNTMRPVQPLRRMGEAESFVIETSVEWMSSRREPDIVVPARFPDLVFRSASAEGSFRSIQSAFVPPDIDLSVTYERRRSVLDDAWWRADRFRDPVTYLSSTPIEADTIADAYRKARGFDGVVVDTATGRIKASGFKLVCGPRFYEALRENTAVQQAHVRFASEWLGRPFDEGRITLLPPGMQMTFDMPPRIGNSMLGDPFAYLLPELPYGKPYGAVFGPAAGMQAYMAAERERAQINGLFATWMKSLEEEEAQARGVAAVRAEHAARPHWQVLNERHQRRIR